MPVQVAPGIRQGTYAFYGRDVYSYHKNKDLKGGRTQAHNHLSEPLTKDARRLRAAVMARCREGGSMTLKEVYEAERRRLGISPDAVALMPYTSLRSSMLRARKQLRYIRKHVKKLFADATFDSVPAGLDASQVWNLTTVRLGKNVTKAANKLGLAVAIRENEDVWCVLRMVCALPLLSMADIQDGLRRIGYCAIRREVYPIVERFLLKIADN